MLWYGWHLVFGSRGLYEIVRQDKETLVASTYREELREEYKDVFHKVNLLNPENPDLDYLDEKIRYFLSLQKANEVVFSFDNEE